MYIVYSWEYWEISRDVRFFGNLHSGDEDWAPGDPGHGEIMGKYTVLSRRFLRLKME